MTTTGQSTTTPMSARAGLSHSNGARRRRAAGIEIFLLGVGPRGTRQGGRRVPREDRSAELSQLADVAVCCRFDSSVIGLPVTARPMVCWILDFTVAQVVLLGYCTEFGSAVRKGAKTGSEDSAFVAVVVAGRRSYSLSKASWYLSW